MQEGRARRAELSALEPNLAISVEERDRLLGHLEVKVEITPAHLTQRHEFTAEIDQSHLPDLARSIRRVLSRFPGRGDAS